MNWRGGEEYKIKVTDPFATQSYTSLVPMASPGEALLVYNKYWCYGGDCPNEATSAGWRSHSHTPPTPLVCI